MYESVLELLLASDEVDAVVVNFTPPLVTRKTDDIAAAIVAAVDRAAALAEEANAGTPEANDAGTSDAGTSDAGAGEQPAAGKAHVAKPVVTSLLGADASGQAVLQTAHFPVPSYIYPETAVRALAHALRYGEWRRRPKGVVPVLEDVDVNEARRRLPHDGPEGTGAMVSGWVTGAAAMDVLAAFGVPVLRTVEAYSAEEAGKWADDIASPVALKVLGPVHKSEGGGVRLGLVGHDAVAAAYGVDAPRLR